MLDERVKLLQVSTGLQENCGVSACLKRAGG